MYPNGEVPFTKLIHVSGNIWLPAGTLARWNWAVEQGVKKYGVRLRITGQGRSEWNTWNGYRPLSCQKVYRNAFGMLAAYPGTSSHGGTYRGREVFALDVDNWAEMGWARFVALMRLAGLTTDFVSPREQWHVGDFNNPWAVPAFASGGGGSHLNPTPGSTPNQSEEDDMPIIIVQKKDSSAAKGQMTHNRKMRLITKYENTAYRAAQAQNRDAVIYVTVSDSDFNSLLAGKS